MEQAGNISNGNNSSIVAVLLLVVVVAQQNKLFRPPYLPLRHSAVQIVWKWALCVVAFLSRRNLVSVFPTKL